MATEWPSRNCHETSTIVAKYWGRATRRCIRIVSALASVAIGTQAWATDVTIREHLREDTLLTPFEGGKTLDLTAGIGGGAFRGADDPPNVIWTLGDRGPNFTCGEAKNITDVMPAGCGEVKNGRVYLTPGYAPSIYRVMILDDGTFRVMDVVTLNGMPNPLRVATTETPAFPAVAPRSFLCAAPASRGAKLRFAD